MTQHTVTSFEDELQALSRSIGEMGGRAEQIVDARSQHFCAPTCTLAHEVIEADKKVDALHRQIEEDAIVLIARRQPMAQDLRETIAAIRIANDLERVGDLARTSPSAPSSSRRRRSPTSCASAWSTCPSWR